MQLNGTQHNQKTRTEDHKEEVITEDPSLDPKEDPITKDSKKDHKEDLTTEYFKEDPITEGPKENLHYEYP